MRYPDFVQPDLRSWLKQFHFSTSLRTRFSETDAFGHINNVSYFIYLEQARIDYMQQLNAVNEVFYQKDYMIVTANLEIHYLSPLYHGQMINIHVRTSRLGKSSFELEYVIEKNGTVAAVGKGALVFIDKKNNQSAPLPEKFVHEIMTLEGMIVEK